MEKYSKATVRQLKIFLQHWLREKDADEILMIDTNRILIGKGDEIREVPICEIIQNNETMLEKCVRDLHKRGIEAIPIPDHVGQSDERRLETLLRLTQQPPFHRRKTSHRLETFYYLGEILTIRGWQKNDIRRIREMFSTNKGASDFKKTARRVLNCFKLVG
jgi:hypothetical protein